MPGAGRWPGVAASALAVLVLAAAPAPAQLTSGGLDPQGPELPDSSVLTLDQDRLFNASRFGIALQARTKAATDALAAENLVIEKRLEEEERALTERRPTLPAAEFAALAEAFDTKVEGIRQAQDAKSRQITQTAEQDRQRFLSAAFPVLGDLMTDAGAVAILPKSTVFMSLNAIDVTDEAIRRIDAVLGDGSAVPGAGQAPVSETPAPETPAPQTPEPEAPAPAAPAPEPAPAP